MTCGPEKKGKATSARDFRQRVDDEQLGRATLRDRWVVISSLLAGAMALSGRARVTLLLLVATVFIGLVSRGALAAPTSVKASATGGLEVHANQARSPGPGRLRPPHARRPDGWEGPPRLA